MNPQACGFAASLPQGPLDGPFVAPEAHALLGAARRRA
jgi:hypothetical protein